MAPLPFFSHATIAQKRMPLTDGETHQTSEIIQHDIPRKGKITNSLSPNGDLASETAVEKARLWLQVLSCTQVDVERQLEEFMELQTHYNIPGIFHSTFGQEWLNSILAPLRMSRPSLRNAEVELLALLVLRQIVTQGFFIGEQDIVDIEPFLQNNDSRLRNEVLRILAITADGKADRAQFILQRQEIIKGM